MQNEDVQKLIFDKFQQLSPQLQKAITSADFSTNLRAIANRYKLHFDQIGALETETMLVLLGVEDPDNFLKNIQTQAGLTRSMAETMAVEINRVIFSPIRQYMIQNTDRFKVPNEPQNPEPKSQLSLSKEDILSEIESPNFDHTAIFAKPQPDYDGHGLEQPLGTDMPGEDPLDLPWDHQPVNISSKLLEDKLTEVVKLPKEHIDIRIDVDAMEKAEEEHKREEEEQKTKRNSYLEWQENQRKIAEAKKAAEATATTMAGNSPVMNVDSLSKKIPPLRVRKAYEADPYREPVE
jgi:hypothetical protein